ncbi:MAG: zf-HC2 domain-containing protein [Acidobacteriota bacterium]
MDCKIVVSSISEFIDGGLATQETHIVEEHLSACPSCSTIKQDLDGLRHAAQGLSLHTPSSTLWLRIRAEAEAETSGRFAPSPREAPSSWWGRFLDRKITFSLPQFAGAGVMVAFLMVSGGYFIREYVNEKPSIGPRDGVATILVPDLEETLRSQVSEFNQRKISWDPSVRADFEHHLQQIDQSIEGCRLILAQNPADQTQRAMARVLVDEKIRLLKDSSRLKW